MRVKRKMLLIPEKFHSVLKIESSLEGKTMTRYLDDIANEVERDNGSIKNFIKKQKELKKNGKNKFNFKL